MRFLVLLVSIFIFILNVGAQNHISWKLDGAEERIEKYRKGKVDLKVFLPDGSLLPAGSLVDIELQKHDFNFGISLTQMHAIYDEPFRDNMLDYVDHLFNYNTIGFYWSANEREPGKWDLREHYQFGLDWAKEKNKTLRGHPLVWHNSAPSWILSETRDVDLIHKDIITHVDRLLKNYPEIDEWDLYNEAPSVTEIRDYIGENNGVARWMDSRGGQGAVIKLLSDKLQEISPESHGLINHFQHEHESYHDLITYCISNSIPIKSVGIQAHMQEEASVWTEQTMWNLMEDYGKYGIPIDFTEITICSCERVEGWKEMRAWQDSIKEARKEGRSKPKRKTSSRYEKYQAEYAHDFYTLAFSHPSIKTIVLWALSDTGSWREFPAGVFDEKGKPKPIYYTLNNLIKKKWHTHAKGKLPVDGIIPINGFLGEYTLKASHNGKLYETTFILTKDKDEPLDVWL
ncbi:MAG: endo-1,4-beta-xylanase [Pontiellaceae bacterium]